MRKIYWPCLILAVLFVSPTFGQYVAVIQACDRDVAKFCAPDRANGIPLTKCTQAHFQDFSEPCKAALVKVDSVADACGADIQAQCPGLRPSGGRILLCVKRHFASLSDACKDAIGQAAERKQAAH